MRPHTQERYAEAIPLYEQAAQTLKAVLGELHPSVGTLYHNLATLLFTKQGRAAEAEPLYRASLAIRAQIFGSKHAQTQSVAVGLWNVLHAKGGCGAEMARLDAAHGI